MPLTSFATILALAAPCFAAGGSHVSASYARSATFARRAYESAFNWVTGAVATFKQDALKHVHL
ncbi:MAG: hypothetical protein EON54_05820 [Alcaligenaceae bacterium]|nr:MAG: hypothetical protein EON54_05820 [Alcaligenaceae bacterium]